MIDHAQKCLYVGMNGSGKSELLNYVWSQVHVRRVLVDSKREWWIDGVRPYELSALDDAGARAQVDAIDWTQPIIQVRHATLGNPGSREQLTALFAAIRRVPGPLRTAIHEAYMVSSAAWCPPGLREEATAGRSTEHGLDVATQRPRNIAVELRTEAEQVFLFPPLDVEDLKESRRGTPFLTITDALRWTHDVPRFGYLWADRHAREVAIGPPLPDEQRLAIANLIRRAAGHV